MTDPTRDGWTGGQRAFGDFAPGLAHYTDRVLFDEVWERPGLSKREPGNYSQNSQLPPTRLR